MTGPTALETRAGTPRRASRQDLVYRYAGVAVIILIVAFFAVMNPNFLTPGNVVDILRSISVSAFLALGVTFSLVVNGFDVSIGSIASLSGIAAAAAMVYYRQELLVAILVPLVLGLLVGVINAFLIVKLKLPDMLATLAMLFVVNGVHLTLTGGYSVYEGESHGGQIASGIIVPSFIFLGQGSVLGIPVPAILLLVAVIVAHLFLNRTTTGRFMYLVGGNEEAARHLGLPIGRLRTLAYALSGLLAAVGGIILSARVGAGQVSAGEPLLMDAVAAAYVGYAIFGQKRPSVIGTLLGAILIGVLLNGLTMMKVPYYAQDIVKGGVFIVALAFTFLRRRDR